MEFNIRVTGHGPVPSTAMSQYAISAEFDGPIEAMTLTVVIPTTKDEAAGKSQAIDRAKELARLFAEQASA